MSLCFVENIDNLELCKSIIEWFRSVVRTRAAKAEKDIYVFTARTIAELFRSNLTVNCFHFLFHLFISEWKAGCPANCCFNISCYSNWIYQPAALRNNDSLYSGLSLYHRGTSVTFSMGNALTKFRRKKSMRMLDKSTRMSKCMSSQTMQYQDKPKISQSASVEDKASCEKRIVCTELIYSQEDVSPEYSGMLSKWTNYVHGWQDRFVSCKDGMLCYHRSEDETAHGCRGSIALSKAVVYCNEFDKCRFDVSINDCVWYLRAADESERRKWISVIEANKSEAATIGANSNSMLRQQGSQLSLGSAPSDTSTLSLQQKLAEMETFRNILYRQIDILQGSFDSCANKAEHRSVDCTYNVQVDSKEEKDQQTIKSAKQQGIDFRGEAITFKATTNSMLNTLEYCVESMNKREEGWQAKLERERERRKTSQLQVTDKLTVTRKALEYIKSADFEKDASSELTEELFFECMEAELDKHDRFEHDVEQLISVVHEAELLPSTAPSSSTPRHRHSDRLESRVKQHMEDSLTMPGDEEGGWELVAFHGQMKVYRRELVIEDRICDPLKAIHSISNVTAREMCHYFWDTSYRMEWEGTVDSFHVVETLDDCTTIVYQTHKRVWPSSQRDCLYLSHMVQVKDQPKSAMGRGKPHDTWMVCNLSVEHPEARLVSGCIRAVIDIALICQTFVNREDENAPITRDNLQCDIVYVANVNPGGWAPAAILRAIYKREYPKFLRRFTAYVQAKTSDKNILF